MPRCKQTIFFSNFVKLRSNAGSGLKYRCVLWQDKGTDDLLSGQRIENHLFRDEATVSNIVCGFISGFTFYFYSVVFLLLSALSEIDRFDLFTETIFSGVVTSDQMTKEYFVIRFHSPH